MNSYWVAHAWRQLGLLL